MGETRALQVVKFAHHIFNSSPSPPVGLCYLSFLRLVNDRIVHGRTTLGIVFHPKLRI